MATDISRKAIEVLTTILLEMDRGRWASPFTKDLDWDGEGTTKSRHELIVGYLAPAGNADAAVTLLSEPDFALRFCRWGTGLPYVVDLQVPVGTHRHAWYLYTLGPVASIPSSE